MQNYINRFLFREISVSEMLILFFLREENVTIIDFHLPGHIGTI